MTDIQRMQGNFAEPVLEGDTAVLCGAAPVMTMQGYSTEVIAYTRGYDRLFLNLKGYEPCHNAEEIIEAMTYDCEKDPENPTGSVFCAHGTGFNVTWNLVEEYMHLESGLNFDKDGLETSEKKIEAPKTTSDAGGNLLQNIRDGKKGYL